jgi:hypothetical protein
MYPHSTHRHSTYPRSFYEAQSVCPSCEGTAAVRQFGFDTEVLALETSREHRGELGVVVDDEDADHGGEM